MSHARAWAATLALLLLALASLPAINWLGGALAAALSLPPGGTGRLAWDLAWWSLSAGFPVWLLARLAPRAATWLAGLLVLALLAATAWALWTMGDDFPPWFQWAVALCTPLASLGGFALARRARTPAA